MSRRWGPAYRMGRLVRAIHGEQPLILRPPVPHESIGRDRRLGRIHLLDSAAMANPNGDMGGNLMDLRSCHLGKGAERCLE